MKETSDMANWAKLNELKHGDTIQVDSGFTCALPGKHLVFEDFGELFFCCAEGRHYLSGQADENGNLIGISRETTHD